MEKLKQRIHLYYQNFDFDVCKEYILKNQKKEYQEILKVANQLLDNIFVFNSRWDMEPCLIPYTLNPLVFDKSPCEDEEWVFMLNRFEYLDKLFIAYLVERDMKYIKKGKELIYCWIDSINDFSPHNICTRTIDTGIRCQSWLNFLMLMIEFDVIEDQSITKIIKSIERQLVYLKEVYIDKYTLSNWGILQTTSMISCYMILKDDIDIEEVYLFACHEIEKQIELQILEDGTQWEQSIMYHVEVCKALLKLTLCDHSYLSKFYKTLYKMTIYIDAMTTPDYHQLAIGDSDITDTRDILTLSSVILKEKKFCMSSVVDIDTLICVGKVGIEQCHSTSKRHRKNYHLFEDSGQVCVRFNDSYLFFKNGPMGSGHTHNDENSLCLYYHGNPIFIDSGRYSYREIEERYYLKSAFAHNSCIIDNQAAEIIKDSWDYSQYPQYIYMQSKEREACYLIEGSIKGVVNHKDYTHQRKIVMIKDEIWLIIDDISMVGNHNVTTQFILDSHVQYEDGCLNDLRLHSLLDYYQKPTYISKQYNQKENSIKIVADKIFEDRYIGMTLLCHKSTKIKQHNVYQMNKSEPLKNAIGYELESLEYHYLIVVMTDELFTGHKLCHVDGIKIRGKCVIYDKRNKKYIRLRS